MGKWCQKGNSSVMTDSDIRRIGEQLDRIATLLEAFKINVEHRLHNIEDGLVQAVQEQRKDGDSARKE